MLHFTALSGVDTFCFIQPKDRKSLKEWWKSSSDDNAEKSLKVTQLQVADAFPACVTRQVVVHRLVYSQSPLEAGVDAISQWCAILFRTAIATSGQAILQQNVEPGIGADATKVVADCIHSSNVKPIGLSLLRTSKRIVDADSGTDFFHDYDRLTDDEIDKYRLIVSRLIVVFVELLHLLIARNRDQLLDVIQMRKRSDGDAQFTILSVGARSTTRRASKPRISQDRQTEPRDPSPVSACDHSRKLSGTTAGSLDGRSTTMPVATPDPTVRLQGPSDAMSASRSVVHHRVRSFGEASVRTDAAIAVQSELQRAFISFCKLLHPLVSDILQEETPGWMRNCTQDNYFSLGTYRHTKVRIADELCFTTSERVQPAGYIKEAAASPHESVAGSSNSGVSRGSRGRESNTFAAV